MTCVCQDEHEIVTIDHERLCRGLGTFKTGIAVRREELVRDRLVLERVPLIASCSAPGGQHLLVEERPTDEGEVQVLRGVRGEKGHWSVTMTGEPRGARTGGVAK